MLLESYRRTARIAGDYNSARQITFLLEILDLNNWDNLDKAVNELCQMEWLTNTTSKVINHIEYYFDGGIK